MAHPGRLRSCREEMWYAICCTWNFVWCLICPIPRVDGPNNIEQWRCPYFGGSVGGIAPVAVLADPAGTDRAMFYQKWVWEMEKRAVCRKDQSSNMLSSIQLYIMLRRLNVYQCTVPCSLLTPRQDTPLLLPISCIQTLITSRGLRTWVFCALD